MKEVAENTTTSSSSTYRVGDRLGVKNDVSAIDAADRYLAGPKDPLKNIYAGERGVVVAVRDGVGPMNKTVVDLKFVDGVTKSFVADCIDTEPTGAKLKVQTNSVGGNRMIGGSTISNNSSVGGAIFRAPDLPIVAVASDTAVPQPTWSALRRPGAKPLGPTTTVASTVGFSSAAILGALKNTAASSAHIDPSPLSPAVPPITLGARDEKATLGGGGIPAAPPIEVIRREASVPREAVDSSGSPATSTKLVIATSSSASSVEPQSLQSDVPSQPPQAPLRKVPSLNTSPRRPRDDDEENERDNLIATPRIDFVRSGSEAPRASTTLPMPSAIPLCPRTYAPRYLLPDPKSRIPRAQMVSAVAVKHCSVILLGDFTTATTMAERKRVTRSIAFRSHQTSMESVYAACSKELDLKGGRVERLFTTDGKEVLFVHGIIDGASYVASLGDSFCPPPVMIDSARGKSPALSDRRARSPLGQRPVLNLSSTSSKPIVVRVYVNGEYGDVQTDTIPYKTVTIRSTYKTLPALYTLITRELQWNMLGRRCDVLYTCRGEEIKSLDAIRESDSIIASSGDRFVIPRANTVLHHEVKEREREEGVSGGRRVSPTRQTSPSRVSATATGKPLASTAQQRANRLLDEIRQVEGRLRK